MILFHMKISPTVPQNIYRFPPPQAGCDSRLCIALDYSVSKFLVNPRKSPQHHSRFHVLVQPLNLFSGTPLLRPALLLLFFSLQDFPLYAPATASGGRSPRSTVPESSCASAGDRVEAVHLLTSPSKGWAPAGDADLKTSLQGLLCRRG